MMLSQHASGACSSAVRVLKRTRSATLYRECDHPARKDDRQGRGPNQRIGRTGLCAGRQMLSKRLPCSICLVVLVILFASSCAERMVVSGGARITLPETPERIAWREQESAETPGISYVDPPVRLKPRESCTAPEDGGILLSPRAWRGIRYGLTEWPRWGETVRAIVDSHNQSVGSGADRLHPWWKLF